jgi:hypothetical protein
MASVFVSYRRVDPDSGLATAIDQFLSSHGVCVFRDTQLRIGDEWARTIEKQLDSADYFVVLVSREAMQSGNVCEEVRRAHKRAIPILPVQLDSAEIPIEMGSILNGIQMLRFDPSSIDAIGREILEVVGRGHTRDDPWPDQAEAEAEPETGTVRLDSPYYVRRDVDTQIEERLQGRGKTILLRGARQVGKSSLLVRAAATAEATGRRVCRFDFQIIDKEQRQSLKSLLRHLAFTMASDLNLAKEPDEYWDDRRGAKISITRFVEHAVLKSSNAQVVLCLDEVDSAFGTAYCEDFFSLLRVWHNERATSLTWNRLHLIITHSTSPALWIEDLNQSPFNVGEQHSLNDFTADQTQDLARRYGVRVDVAELMTLVSGHPFLVRKALSTIRKTACTVGDLASDAENSPFREHLQLLLEPLHSTAKLREAMRQVLDRGACESEKAFQRLLGAGLVKGSSRDAVAPRCELYGSYFGKHI